MNIYLKEAVFVGGAWEKTPESFSVKNPANGSEIGRMPLCGSDTVLRAIDAAEAAFAVWSSTPAKVRGRIIRKMADVLLEDCEILAELITKENGKPISESIGEVKYTASYLQWYAEEAQRIYGQTIPANSSRSRILVQKEPVGVCAMITPWNFPLAMLGRKVAAALAAGCVIVAKPAEDTPFSGLALGLVAQKSGLPPGVLNIVTGDAPLIGRIMCASTKVRKLSFTGSSEVGRLLMEQCAPTLKRLSLELGGNAPFLVFEDANISAAVQGAMASKFRNCGQTCIASNRFLVHRDVLDEFISGVEIEMDKLKVGNGAAEDVSIGPMINKSAVDKVRALLQDALDKGAKLHRGQIPGASLFVEPVLLSGVDSTMDMWSEEIFGPVMSIRAFSSDEEAVALANDTPFGLAAYVFTNSAQKSWRVPEALEYGMVGLNTGAISTAQAPFGGVKQSGIGREGGPQGLDDYLQIKYICHQLS